MDQFSVPSSEDTRAPQAGTLEVGRAVSEGVGALLANLLQIIAVNVLLVVLLYMSCCTIIGFFVALPVLMWGFYAFTLQAIDGRGEIGTLFVGVGDPVSVTARMGGLLLCLGLIYSPIAVVSTALMLPDIEGIMQGRQPDPIVQALRFGVPSLLWSLVTVRVLLAPYFVVERDRGPLEALQGAWEATAGHWGKLIVLVLLLNLLLLPGQVLSIGAQLYGQQGNPLEPDLTTLGLQLGSIAITMIASTLSVMFFASAYRQLTGPAPASA